MFTKYLQKFLIYFFTIIFVAVLIVGIFKLRQNKESQSLTPVATTPNDSTTTSSASSSSTNTNGQASTATNSSNATSSPSPSNQNAGSSSGTAGTTATPATTSKSYTGKTYQNPWGDTTVKITVADGKLTNVETTNYPDSPPSTYAHQYLIQQALQAGNANIQGVSGATSTSLAFQYSLESALAQAGIK